MQAHKLVTSTKADFGTKTKKQPDLLDFKQILDRLIASDTLQTMMISPEMASAMLERNTGNRTLSATRVARRQLAADWGADHIF